MDTRVLPLRDLAGRPLLAMVVKRVYRLAGDRLVAAGSVELREEPEYTESTNPGALERLVADTDLFAPLKPSTDVLVRGAAWSARGPVRMLDTAVHVGPLRKSVRVWGRRVVKLDGAARPRFSPPEPFESAPLVWDHAYGGRDLHAEELRGAGQPPARERLPQGTLAYPRNPSGRGFLIDAGPDRLDGTEAPRLEDPGDPVMPGRLLARTSSDWPERPAAACYEPVDWMVFPRVSFWPTEWPAGAVLDPRLFNCAPAGLCGARLAGNELVRLWNLHPTREYIEVALPGERPKLLLEPPGCGIYELTPLLQTVLIEPDAERMMLTWAGSMEVAAPFSKVACEGMRSAVRWES